MTNKLTILIAGLVLLLAGCAGTLPGLPVVGGGGSIRVLVVKGAGEVRVRGGQRMPAAGVVVKASGDDVLVGGAVSRGPVKFAPEDGFIYVDDRSYRGVVEVASTGGRLMVVDELPMEDYLVGVINSEISSSWPVEAVKAQAVVARTYASFQRSKRAGEFYHLEGGVLGQAYDGASGEDSAATDAVRKTRSEVLTYDHEIALTVYHANAGGRTESSREVWQKDYPYLRSVESRYDDLDPRYDWELELTADELRERLARAGFRIGLPEAIIPEDTTGTGRVKTLIVKDSYNRGVRLRGEDLRRVIGYSELRSTMFEVTQSGYLFIFKGRGSGHGVGLSQWGAKGMAEAGEGYRDILRHYYPGTRLSRR